MTLPNPGVLTGQQYALFSHECAGRFIPTVSDIVPVVWYPQIVPILSPQRKNLELFKRRQLTQHHFSQQTILSSSELSDLYHFPDTSLTKTEGLVKSRSRVLPAPLSIKRSDAELDVIVGVNTHGGDNSQLA